MTFLEHFASIKESVLSVFSHTKEKHIIIKPIAFTLQLYSMIPLILDRSF